MVRRVLIGITIVVLSALAAFADEPQKASAAQARPAPPPDVEMTTYYFVLLRRGPAWTAEKTPEIATIQEGHMANIRAMFSAGKLVVAGPFLDQTGPNAVAGLFVLKVGSVDEAKKLTAEDPAVKAGRLTAEVFPWLGPATLHY